MPPTIVATSDDETARNGRGSARSRVIQGGRRRVQGALGAAQRMWGIARLRPFDTTTPEGQSRERYRRAFLTTLSSGLAKGVAMGTALISVPLTLRYLGSERYGLWAAISSMIMFLNFSDLGINNGLLNGIARAHGKGDRELARQYVSSAFFSLTAITALIAIVFAATYHWIPWYSVFRVTSPAAMREAGPAVAAFAAFFLCSIPATIVSRVQAGYQDGFAANLWTSLGSILSLLALLLVIHAHGSLVWLVLALGGSPIVALILNGIVLFGAQRPWLRPSWAHVRGSVSRDLLRSGGLFFILQITVAIGFSSDNLVLVRVLGPDAVTQYSVPARLFNIIVMLSVVLLTPFWPAYGEALARRDHPWIRRTLLRTLALSVGFSVILAALVVLCGTTLIHWWVGSTVTPSLTLILGLGLWSIICSVSNASTTFLNGVGLIPFQVIVASIAALLNIGLSIYLTYRIGVPGVIYGSIVSQLLVCLVPHYIYIRRYLRGGLTDRCPQTP